jgi:hypothetical protein
LRGFLLSPFVIYQSSFIANLVPSGLGSVRRAKGCASPADPLHQGERQSKPVAQSGYQHVGIYYELGRFFHITGDVIANSDW